MEIAVFLGGTTRTASDQSMSIGTASGSFATALAMSSSVRASTRTQSVLPFLGKSLETVVIFFSLIASRAPCRDDPAVRTAERACDRDFPPLDVPEDLVPDFAMTIRSADEGVAVENSSDVLEVDLVIAQIASRFFGFHPKSRTPANSRCMSSAIANRPQKWVSIRLHRSRFAMTETKLLAPDPVLDLDATRFTGVAAFKTRTTTSTVLQQVVYTIVVLQSRAFISRRI